MYKSCYHFENKMTVSNLIEIIENYPDYSICVFDDKGIIFHTDKEVIQIEHYHFDDMMFSFINPDDYYEFLNDSHIYRTISAKDFIELIKPFKHAYITVADNDDCYVFIGDNKISFNYTSNVYSGELLQEMNCKEGSQFIRVI